MRPNIIGISGRIGSGKDTVGKIIQYLTSEAYTSRGRTYEEFLRGNSNPDVFGYYYHSDWEIKKFAGKLKEVASLLTGISVHKFEDQEFKKTNLPSAWDRPIPGEDWVDGEPVLVPMTVRQLLQTVGTDCMRSSLHDNVWVNALFADYAPPKMSEYNPSKWLITDTRFPNEVDAIKSRGGIIIKVKRDEADSKPATHVSETSLDNYAFDYVIDNNSTLENLIIKTQEMLDKYSLK